MTTVGFDFGNLNCVIARCVQGGGTDVLLDGSSQRQSACVVSMQGKQRFMGNEAAAIHRSNYKNTPLNMKRLLGRKFSEPEVRSEMELTPGLKYVELQDGTVGVELIYNDECTVLSMEQCVAMMLNKLVKITLEATGSEPGDCVIAVPGWYTDAQRRAMLNACEIARLPCRRLLNEGTAVAIEYGIYKSVTGVFDAVKPLHVAFLDLGQSSYSCTVASYVTGKLKIGANCNDRGLGGRDFDEVIARKIAAVFQDQHKADAWANDKARIKLFAAAEKAKKALSPTGVKETNISVEGLLDDIDFTMTLTLNDFVAASEPLLARLVSPIQLALEHSGLPPDAIVAVELVGGSTRLGFVKKRLASILAGAGVALNLNAVNSGLSTTMNADEAVAQGAAWEAALLSVRAKVKDFDVIDVIGFTTKLTWEKSVASLLCDADNIVTSDDRLSSVVIFKKNDPTPEAKQLSFAVSNSSFAITAAYDESALADLPKGADPMICTFQFEVPADFPAEEKYDVHFRIAHNINGIVDAHGAHLLIEEKRPPHNKVNVTVTSPSVGMTRARVDTAIESEAQMELQDKVIEETNAARNEFEAFIFNQRHELSEKSGLGVFFTSGEKQALEDALARAEEWLYYGDGNDAHKSAYKQKLAELSDTPARRSANGRQKEWSQRNDSVQSIDASLKKYRHWLGTGGGAPVDRDALNTLCSKTKSWLDEMLKKQEQLKLHDDPVITSEDIRKKHQLLVDGCKAIMDKTPKVEESRELPSPTKPKTSPIQAQHKSSRQPVAMAPPTTALAAESWRFSLP